MATEIAGRLVFDGHGQQQVAALDAVTAGPVDEPPGAPHPAARASDLPAQHQGHTRPERAPGRAQLLPGLEVRAVGAPQHADVLLLAPKHVRRCREPLEVPRFQPAVPIGTGQRLMRVPPRPADEGL